MLKIKSEKAKGNKISVLLAILKIQVRIGRTQNSSGSFPGEKKKENTEMLTDLQKVMVWWSKVNEFKFP